MEQVAPKNAVRYDKGERNDDFEDRPPHTGRWIPFINYANCPDADPAQWDEHDPEQPMYECGRVDSHAQEEIRVNVRCQAAIPRTPFIGDGSRSAIC
jgi:hypothetical protein